MKNARAITAFLVSLTLATATTGSASIAAADDLTDAQTYVQKENTLIASLLKQPASQSRDRQITSTLDGYVDYEELTRRAFGEPCPMASATRLLNCTNHWTDLTEPQHAEVTSLLKQLVEKNYRKNLIKTLDWDVRYDGAKEARGGESRVLTEATNKTRPRDPSIKVDYLVHGQGGGSFKVVDIITEGSSLTKNYYDQFHRMLINKDQGYAYVVKKLQERIAKRD